MNVRTASEGMWLFNGGAFSQRIEAPDSVDLSEWEEVTDAWKLQFELDSAEPEVDVTEVLNEKQAYQNALYAMFDGVKYVADRNKRFAVEFPMYVRANMFYEYNDTPYVCFQTGIMQSAAQLDDYLIEDII